MLRQNNYTTSFPAGTTMHNTSNSSERMGAFGTLPLDHQVPGPSTQNRPTSSNSMHEQIVHIDSQNHYHQTPTISRPLDAGSTSRHTYIPLKPHMKRSDVYQPTVSNADTSESRKKYDNLSDVYTMSGDTVEFARNLGQYLNEKIPYIVTVSLLIILCIVFFIFGLIGALNIPFCEIQPMIPVWLIIASLLFIVSAIFRIYNLIPSPPSRHKTLSLDLCVKGLEVLLAIANIVWLILGAVWVYGNKAYVHFEETFFQEHYCEETVYWTAFIAVTGYLILICFLIVGLIVLLCVGSYKEATPREIP
ncbi:unnamed protein product [Auanema sp. JU1783]|nr:unnamed protein product [Auanema sp. JU1783]